MEILILVVCAVVVIIAIFGLAASQWVNIEASAEQHIIRDDSFAESILGKIHPSNIQWIYDHSFVYHTAFELNDVESCVFRKENAPIDLVVGSTSANTLSYELITHFSDGTTLTSTINRASGLWPFPNGDYAESIACANVQELFVAHGRSTESLEKFLGVTECTPTPDFYDTWIALTKKRAVFWKSHNFWPLSGVYWMFTRHFTMRDKNIDFQLKKNWIKRPR